MLASFLWLIYTGYEPGLGRKFVDLRRFIPFFDPSVESWAMEARLLRWLTFLWLFVGLVVLFSASYHIGIAESGDGLYYFKRQLLWTAVGLTGFQVLVHTPLRRVLAIAPVLFFFFLALVFSTQIPGVGTTVNGATRWISLGPFPLQPSELMKPLLVLQSALVFGQWSWLTVRMRLIWLGLFGAVLLGILIQPNLSTTALCGITLWLVALAAGLPYSRLVAAAVGGVLLAGVSVSRNEYQLKRILSFLNPWADPTEDGFQLIQSLLAVGSGGTWGAGFGFSQQKLSYLPIQHTDFIFSVYAEEFGLVGGIFLILLLTTYSFLALGVAMKTENLIWRLIAIGTTVLMVGQALLNIGVAIGALPTTGLPLPLFSYGGSSMIASLLVAGLLIRVAREASEAAVIPFKAAVLPVNPGLATVHRLIQPGRIGGEQRTPALGMRRSGVKKPRVSSPPGGQRSPADSGLQRARNLQLQRLQALGLRLNGPFEAGDRPLQRSERRPRPN